MRRETFPGDCPASCSPGGETTRIGRGLGHTGEPSPRWGSLFSASGKFRQCLRLNYAFTLTPAIEDAVRTVGGLAAEMVADAQAHAVGVG
ncbi:hypothetical protein ACT3UM_01070 [Halomonas sp. AOP13-D3-9]